MKKLLMSSLVLTAFSVSILLFQISCKKEAIAQTSGGQNSIQLNKILYLKGISTGTSSTNQTFKSELWISDYDGTNQKLIPVVLPSGVEIATYPKLSPDGKTIFFDASKPTTIPGQYLQEIYSCSIDGTNLKKIISGSVASAFSHERVYLSSAN